MRKHSYKSICYLLALMHNGQCFNTQSSFKNSEVFPLVCDSRSLATWPHVQPNGANGVQKERFLRMPEVEGTIGRKRSSIYADVKAGKFPEPIRISTRCTVWRESDVQKWMAERIKEAQEA